MENSKSNKKVRATELLLATRGAKAAILSVRRWFKKIRASSGTGKTSVEIPIDQSANRENEINEARITVLKRDEEMEKEESKRRLVLNEDELRNIANENLENELRELMSGIGMTDSDRRA